jgi:GYF domain 2
MNYFVKRGDQQYGPYTLAALQQYVAQGNISRDDLARSEAMTDWVAVSTIIGNVAVAAPSAFGASPANMVMPANLPPKLHWAVVLVLGIVTLGIFIVIWVFVQASWIRKVRPQSKAIFYLLGYVVAIGGAVALQGNAMAPFLQIAGMVVYLIGIFMMRSDIEEYWTTITPAGRSLSGVMTFFFNGIYFQYCLNELREVAENQRAAGAAV